MELVRTQSLTKRYGAVTALDNVSLSLHPGITGLVGSNGAGKSTLIKTVLGLLEPTSGTVQVLGKDPFRDGAAVRQRIGYMPEHDCLPPDLSGTEFVASMARVSGLPVAAARERTAEMLRHVGLYEERYRRIDSYSTGMKQRVKLAQALVHDPELLLLDEPTNGLDPARRVEMLQLIRRTGTDFGISVVVSSHLLSEIETVCDHLVVIEEGRLVSAAPLADFTRERGILLVRVTQGARALADRLAQLGASARAIDDAELTVAVQDETIYTLLRDTVADMELAPTRIEMQRARLEDIFADGAPAAAAEASA